MRPTPARALPRLARGTHITRRRAGLAAALLLPATLLLPAPAGAATSPAPTAAVAQPAAGPSATASRAGRDSAARALLSRTRVVVSYRAGTSPARRVQAAASVAGRRTTGVASLGVEVLAVADAQQAAATLAADPAVAWAEPQVLFRRLAEVAQPELAQVGVTGTGAWPAGVATDGDSQIVGVIDDGVETTLTDLAGRVLDGGAFINGAAATTGGTTTAGDHGTAVAGIVAAGINGVGIRGVVPAARVRAFRVFAPRSEIATDLDIANAIVASAEAAVRDRATAGGPDMNVVNISLGSPFSSTIVAGALSRARARAPWLTFVAAAGNDGSQRPSYPAAYPGVFSVGASADIGGVWQQAPFSTKADVDVLAPGVNVQTWARVDGRYAVTGLDGTSFAAPLVAGVLAGLADSTNALGTAGATPGAATSATLRAAVKSAATAATQAPAIGNGSGHAHAGTAYRRFNGTQSYGTVFVDHGAVVGASYDVSHRLEAVRVTPAPAAPQDPQVTASQGSVTGVTVVTAAGPARSTDTVRVASATYEPPDSAAQPDATLTSGDTVPLLLVLAEGGGYGAPGVATTLYRPFLDPFTSPPTWTRSFRLVQGTTVRVGVTFPDLFGIPLAVWTPRSINGRALVYDTPLRLPGLRPDGATVSGSYSFVAPRTGHYAIGFMPYLDGVSGGYSFSVAPTTVPELASSVATTSRFPVTWATPSSGVTFDVDFTSLAKNSAGQWVALPYRRWLTGTTAGSAVFSGGAGVTYYFRVQPRDASGPFAPLLGSTIIPLDDRSAGVGYSGAWQRASASDRWLATTSRTGVRGSAVGIVREGSAFTLIGDKCPTCGRFQVFLDGRLMGTYESGTTTTRTRQVLWTSGRLAGGISSHAVRVVNLATPGRPVLAVDGFAVRR